MEFPGMQTLQWGSACYRFTEEWPQYGHMGQWGKQKWENGVAELQCGGYKHLSRPQGVLEPTWPFTVVLNWSDGTNLCASHWSVLNSDCPWGEEMSLGHSTSFGQRQCWERNSAVSLQQAALPWTEGINAWVLKGRLRQHTLDLHHLTF